MAPRDIVTTTRPASLDDVHTLLERAAALGGYTPSPADWRDEVLYFLLPDRFSDGREDTRELLTQTRRAALRTTPARPDIDWREWAACWPMASIFPRWSVTPQFSWTRF